MWLSKRRGPGRIEAAQVGSATLEGEAVGVYLDGERREVPVYGPGGYAWRPALGQELLVIKGEEGPCVAGAAGSGSHLRAGEVLLFAGEGGASLRLCNDGSIELMGRVLVNGVPIEELGGGESGGAGA